LADPATIELVTPPDKASVAGELINVVAVPKGQSFDKVQIFVNGRKEKEVKQPAGKKFVCADGILLSAGINKLRIVTLKGAGKVAEQNFSVMLRAPLSSVWNTTPSGFTDYNFHDGNPQKGCAPCHWLDFKEWKDNPSAAEKSPCYTCHKTRLSAYQLGHGPAAVWSCVVCHNGGGDKSKAEKLEADGSSCAACHDDAVAAWNAKKFVHGPLAMGGCQTCHDPHASDQTVFLKMPVFDLCISCHAEIVSKPHVTAGFSGKGHPLRLLQNPLKPGKEFNCVSCHNPHGSDTEFLLNTSRDPANMTVYCRSCHTF
jgi:predicted CXXCH cytochrome family protein